LPELPRFRHIQTARQFLARGCAIFEGIPMSYFEYKVIPAPSQRRWRQRSVDGMDKYASTIADLMTEMGLEGWDFIGAEALKERRRRFFLLICDIERTLMIFRRPAQVADLKDRLDAAASENDTPEVPEPVTPRRVRRPDLVAQVAAGARRVQVNVVERVDVATAVADAESGPSEPEDGQVLAATESTDVADEVPTAALTDASPVKAEAAKTTSTVRNAADTDKYATPDIDDLVGRAHKLERAVRQKRAAATDPSGVAAE
jgi:hypothetical protein